MGNIAATLHGQACLPKLPISAFSWENLGDKLLDTTGCGAAHSLAD
jgi:hypothetical protein